MPRDTLGGVRTVGVMHPQRTPLYPALLWNATRLSEPLNVVVYAMLTMLLLPNELFHPRTSVVRGNLEVFGGNRPRAVPLGAAALQAVGHRDGALRSLLNIDVARTWGMGELLSMYAEQLDCIDAVPLEKLAVIGIDHLLRDCVDDVERVAVLSYAGLGAQGVTDHHPQVARRIDQAVSEAGLVY